MSVYQKINEMITARLIERIEATQQLPWKKPWTSISLMPKNLVTGKNYRGVNVFLLHMLGYASPYFLSMKQVNAMGGKVRRGEKACPVVFWRFVDAKEDAPDEKGYAMLRYYRVFNVDQCEGLPVSKVPVVEIPKREHEPLEVAEQLISSMDGCPEIKHGCRQASYSPSLDRFAMPDAEVFHSGESYYAALFHEISHGTGHSSRLARKGIVESKGFGNPFVLTGGTGCRNDCSISMRVLRDSDVHRNQSGCLPEGMVETVEVRSSHAGESRWRGPEGIRLDHGGRWSD